MDSLHLISEHDRRELIRIMGLVHHKANNPVGRGVVGLAQDDMPAPEVYVVKTPAAGIPALRTGGTAGPPSLVLPGYADCPIWQLIISGTQPQLVQLQYFLGGPTYSSDYTVRVYNSSGASVPGNAWVPVGRDKFGYWYVLTSAASFLAIITDKDYLTYNPMISYSWVEALDDDNPPLFYDYGTRHGGPPLSPAWHTNNIGLPVPSPVRLWPGSADKMGLPGFSYYLFGEAPRVEIFRRDAFPAAGSIYSTGFVEEWLHNLQANTDRYAALLVDANG